jgi:hypothetical protein
MCGVSSKGDSFGLANLRQAPAKIIERVVPEHIQPSQPPLLVALRVVAYQVLDLFAEFV